MTLHFLFVTRHLQLGSTCVIRLVYEATDDEEMPVIPRVFLRLDWTQRGSTAVMRASATEVLTRIE